MIGAISMSGDLDKFCIFALKPEEVGEGGAGSVIIAAPADTKEEAVRIAGEFSY